MENYLFHTHRPARRRWLYGACILLVMIKKSRDSRRDNRSRYWRKEHELVGMSEYMRQVLNTLQKFVSAIEIEEDQDSITISFEVIAQEQTATLESDQDGSAIGEDSREMSKPVL